MCQSGITASLISPASHSKLAFYTKCHSVPLELKLESCRDPRWYFFQNLPSSWLIYSILLHLRKGSSHKMKYTHTHTHTHTVLQCHRYSWFLHNSSGESEELTVVPACPSPTPRHAHNPIWITDYTKLCWDFASCWQQHRKLCLWQSDLQHSDGKHPSFSEMLQLKSDSSGDIWKDWTRKHKLNIWSRAGENPYNLCMMKALGKHSFVSLISDRLFTNTFSRY